MHNVIECLWPLLQPIEGLNLDPRNARQHPQANLDALKRSIQAYGQRKPIIVNDDTGIIEAGNGLYQAAKELGWTEIAVAKVKDDPTTATGYAIMDNQSALLAEWDMPTLKDLLEELDTGDFDMALTGFDMESIEDMMTQFHVPEEGLTDDDVVPEEVEAICKPGDLWKLGNHRLLCGDATIITDVERLMGGEKADICLTDPPYGLGEISNNKNNYNQFNDTKDAVANMAIDWLPLAKMVSNVVVFSCGVTRQWLYPEPDWVMCWFYGGGALRSKWGFNCWQPFLCYGNEPSLAKGMGCRPDAIDMNTPANAKDLDHPCPKPLKLWQWFIERLTFKVKIIIFDPFLGSGTTLIACEKLNRRCYGMEIDPHYCDVIIKRWEDYTGQKAELDG